MIKVNRERFRLSGALASLAFATVTATALYAPTPAYAAACATAWAAGTIYTAGNTASKNGINYVANWWTQGNDPATNNGGAGSGQPWTSQGVCGGATCTAKPAAPTGVAASGTTSSGTNLNWNTVTPPTNCSISGYTVYQGGTAKATASSGTSYAVTGLSPSTTYSFTVAAIDGAGTSAQSSSVSVTTSAASGLNPSLPPGKNFNLSGFTLQLPTGSSGNIDTASGSSLAAGFTKQPYFFTDPNDGSMVMADPAVGWTTSGSLHPRVEMRENATWSTSGTNIEAATVAVTKVPSNTAIAQIFQGTGPSKPLCELQVNSGGKVQLLLENTNQGGNAAEHPVGTVSIGSKFTYSLQLKGTTITVKVNSATTTFTMDSSFNGENFYFKAGDYDQTAVSGTPSTTASTIVKYYALTITH